MQFTRIIGMAAEPAGMERLLPICGLSRDMGLSRAHLCWLTHSKHRQLSQSCPFAASLPPTPHARMLLCKLTFLQSANTVSQVPTTRGT